MPAAGAADAHGMGMGTGFVHTNAMGMVSYPRSGSCSTRESITICAGAIGTTNSQLVHFMLLGYCSTDCMTMPTCTASPCAMAV